MHVIHMCDLNPHTFELRFQVHFKTISSHTRKTANHHISVAHKLKGRLSSVLFLREEHKEETTFFPVTQCQTTALCFE